MRKPDGKSAKVWSSPAVKHRLRGRQLCIQAPGAHCCRLLVARGATGQAGKWGRMLPAASALREANMVHFILDLVVKVFETNTNTQLPPAPSLWRICQEIAFSPLAAEPLEEPTAGLKWLGHVEHLAIPVLDWKLDTCDRS